MENNINWEEVRINAAINIMNAILSSSLMTFILEFIFKKQVSYIAVNYADKLVEELKKSTCSYQIQNTESQTLEKMSK